MKEIGFLGDRGTNREMAAQILIYLSEEALSGNDLSMEKQVVKRVHRQCWGGCSGDSDFNSQDEEY